MYTDYTDYNKYINNNQDKTCYNLVEKIYPIEKEPINDIIIEFDATKLNQNSFELLQNMQNILGEVEEVGEYEIDIFRIKIKELNNRINNNIYIK